MKKLLALILALCMTLTAVFALAENKEESKKDAEAAETETKTEEKAEEKKDKIKNDESSLSVLLSQLFASDELADGQDSESLGALLGGLLGGKSDEKKENTESGLSGMLSGLFGSESDEKGSGFMDSLKSLFGGDSDEKKTEEKAEGSELYSPETIKMMLEATGMKAAEELKYKAAEKADEFYCEWKLSAILVMGYQLIGEELLKYTDLTLTFSADKIECKTAEETKTIAITSSELKDGALAVNAEGEINLKLTENDQLVIGDENVEILFTKK